MAVLKVLFVDDDESILAAFRRNLRRTFEVVTASSASDALQLIEMKGPFAVIVSDMTMPGMNGVEFLREASKLSPDTVRVMLTGNADQQTATDAVNEGHVFRFVNKPCPLDDLIPVVQDAGNQFRVRVAERKLLEKTLAKSIKALADILGMTAPYALGQGQHLRECIVPFAKIAGVSSVWELEVAALLSSIGYASVPRSVVSKIENEEELSPEESEIVKNVPLIGRELVSGIPRLQNVGEIIHYQRKRFDGKGFPVDTVSDVSIPLGARMIKMLQDRIALERHGIVKQDALKEMKGRVGEYDPRLLELCFRCFPEFLQNSIESDKPVVAIDISKLEPGQITVSDIFTSDGYLLIGAGSRFTEMTIRRLRNYESLGQVSGPILVQAQ